ncbi:hypothetical protein GALMADRAFT_249778 [Galerina marginata CBS 339.88]|uniref:Uncharacterized protein n=1 Tax=Galerina marginata (strain CBS 339.88) TaxID=685588 RepID=A0A067T783_GALM3|nr:hypothetical protein GALMADRAFT_249778 [Galerina marginata CBS 339.88]
MPSACNGTGIIPNPDISGIGVRAAIYAQAVLTLVQPTLASIDGRISEKELIGLHRLYLGILLPGCALLVSAIIQATTHGLSVYHAILVLQLSWINNTSALIFFQFALIAQIGLDKEREFRQRVGLTLNLFYTVVKNTPDGDPDGICDILKKKAFTLKSALTKQEKFPQSQDILDEVVQNLSALRAAVTDDSEGTAGQESEVKKAVNMTNQRVRLLRSLGVDIGDRGPKPWWKWTGRGLQRITEWLIERFPATERVLQLLNRDWIMATLASAHLTLFAAFGIWVWFTIDHFGDCDTFTRDTRLTILPGVNIPVVSPLQMWSIVLYIICLIPFLNIIFIGALELLAIPLIQLIFFPRSEKLNLGSFIVLTLLVQAYFITTTELTIQANQHLLVDSVEEADWTFGQTLAVALVAIPLIDVVKQIWEERKAALKMIKGLWGKWRRTRTSSAPVPDQSQVYEMDEPAQFSSRSALIPPT